MDTQTEEFSVSLSIFQDQIQLGLRVMKFLFVLSMLLGAVSTAQAQAPPQQYVYGSQPTTPTSSVISGFSKATICLWFSADNSDFFCHIGIQQGQPNGRPKHGPWVTP